MRLIYKQPYLSIEQFNPVDVPDFVVLTGVNGSGKSHLLDAIEKRHVAVEGMENPHIVLFNYETFKLENEQAFNAHQLASEREAAWQYHQQYIKPEAHNWRSGLGGTYDGFKSTCTSEKKSFWSLATEQLKPYKQQFKNFFNRQDIRKNQ